MLIVIPAFEKMLSRLQFLKQSVAMSERQEPCESGAGISLQVGEDHLEMLEGQCQV
jgi:hypothetical protein